MESTVGAAALDAGEDQARGRMALRALAVWMAVSLLFVPQLLLLNELRPTPAPVLRVLLNNALMFLVWAALTPLVFAAARLWPVGRGRAGARVLLHLGLGIVFALAHAGVLSLLQWPTAPAGVGLATIVHHTLYAVGATNALLYGATLACAHALLFLRRTRAAERAQSDAQLAALRAQLHPHFLFNSLNAVGELVHRDAPMAEHLLLRLSDLLRRTLSGKPHEVTLAEELDFVGAYLEIQQLLMGARLKVEYHVPERLLAARVPDMLLQPLVENAIRHGLSRVREGGELIIDAHLAGDALEIDVCDTGAGPPPALREGVGLRNTRLRLAALYGSQAVLETMALAPGFCATVRIPLRRREGRDDGRTQNPAG